MATNLNDTIQHFQASVELVHEFVKGNPTVEVQGSEGSYPSLAKIAVEAKQRIDSIVNDINEAVEENESVLAATQAALKTAEDALDNIIRQARGIISINYDFENTTEVTVRHGLQTKRFSLDILAIDGAKVYESEIKIIDLNSFTIKFNAPETGNVEVLFYLNT